MTTVTPTATPAPTAAETDRRDAVPVRNGRRRGLGFRIPLLPIGTRRVVPRRPAAEGSEWEVRHESPGRIRFQNERLHRRKELCQAIERELMSILGIDNYKTSDLTGSVLILYDARQLNQAQLVEILDSAIAQAEVPEGKDKADLHLPLCTASLPLAAAAQFLAPPLAPGRRGAVPLHLDPDLPKRPRGPVRRAPAGRRRARRHRGRRLPRHDAGLPRHRAVLVPGVRPRPGQEDAGRLQAAAPERLRQAAPVRLALQGRRRGPGRDGPAPGRRRHRGQHRRGRAGRRLHQGRDGHDRPARADRRIHARREGDRRPRLRLHRDGRRQDLRRGREGGQRDRVGEDQPDPERHGRLQAHLAAQGRAAGRQGGHPHAGPGQRRDGDPGARRRRGDPQQRLRHGHPHGRAAGDALLAGAVRRTRASWSRTAGRSS